MKTTTQAKPKLKVIQGDRRALEFAAVQAIVSDPEHLADYFERLTAPAGQLSLVSETACVEEEPCEPRALR